MHTLRQEFSKLQVREITEAKGFESALEKGDFDVVITDYRLCWTDGLAILRAVKERYPRRPVIMVTGTGNEEITVEAMKSGLDDYVIKSPEHFVRLSPAVRLSLEKTRQRQALQEAENRYQSLFDGVPIGLYRATTDGQILNANPALAEILGYPDSESLLIVNIVDLWVDTEKFRQWQVLMEQDGLVRDFEAQLRRHDGTIIWVDHNAKSVRDANGRLLYKEGSLEDISERKRMAKQQRTTTEGLRSVVAVADELITCPDVDTLFRSAVELARNKLGLERCSIFLAEDGYMRGTYGTDQYGRTTEEHASRFPVAEDWWEDWREHFQDLGPQDPRWFIVEREHLEWDGEKTVPTGSEGWIAGTLIQSLAGPIGVFYNDAAISGAAFDEAKQEVVAVYCSLLGSIIERKRVEETLQEERNRVQKYLDIAGVMFIAINAKAEVTLINQRGCEILGYQKEDIIGRNWFDNFIPENVRSEVKSVFKKLMAEGIELVEHFENPVLTKNDGERVIAWHNTILKDETDYIIGTLSSGEDITERRRAEENLRESNRLLEETLAELKETRQQAIQQERLRALGQLASGIAHDFNNALTPILGYADLMFMVPQILDDKEQVKRYLELMTTTAKDAMKIVRRLREFYRQREEDEIFLPIDLNQLVKQAVDLAQPKWKDQAQASDINIDIKIDVQEVPPVNGNEAELREMLTNLIFNAVDAMLTGGTITLHTRADEEHVFLEVSDTGIGMTGEVKALCFEPFFTTKGEKGTGLGLSMVYGIIQRHEGEINIVSASGEGTTFIVKLPILIEKQDEGRTQKTTVLSRSLHVLVVDDEQMVRDLVTEYLTADGHTFETAKNGREGLEKFCTGRYDVVVTDRAMPEMSGMQLVRFIKRIAPNKPIIMLTGFGDMMKEFDEMPSDIDQLVSKPLTLDEFREALAMVTAEV